MGGLLYNSGEYPFQNRTFLSDFNNAQDSGIYLLGNVGSYKNSPGFNYGLMVVFASYYILQMCIDSSATTIKVRVCIDKNAVIHVNQNVTDEQITNAIVEAGYEVTAIK